MRKQQLEANALKAVRQVVDEHDRIEDTFTECKGNWPDVTDPVKLHKTARQIAGLANAARGNPITWIIGLDEDAHTITAPAPDVEAANWWPAVQRRFDGGIGPDLDTVLHATTDHGPVVVLHFTTDRSPYMVTTNGQGQLNREVPWRAGNKTDSATRQQLLLLLVEKVAVPQLELVDPVLDIGEDSTIVVNGEPVPPPATVLDLRAVLFISADAQTVLPAHRWSLTVTTPAWQAADTPPEQMELTFAPHHQPTGILTFGSPLRPPPSDPTAGVQIHGAGLAVNNTGSVMLTARCQIEPLRAAGITCAPTVTLDLQMPLATGDYAAHVNVTLEAAPASDGHQHWVLRADE